MNLSAALAMFDDHLPDIRKACVENYQALQAEYSEAKEISVDEPWTKEAIHQHIRYLKLNQAVAPIVNVIKRIDNRKKYYRSTTKITDADIDRAREYPIAELWAELVNTPIKGGMANCCFHNDKTASLSLKKHNRYKCFGCYEKGDVIDLYMKLNNVTFIDAVKALL